MRNLLIISGTTSTAGGQQRSLSLLCNGLTEQGDWNVTLACLHGGKPYYPVDERVKVICLSDCAKSRPAKVLRLIKIIKQADFHLIVGYGYTTQILLGVLGLRFSTPIVYCERIYPFIKHAAAGNIMQTVGVFCIRGKNAVFQSHDVAQYYKRLKKHIVIPNILNTDILPSINAWQTRCDVVINASRCVPHKNQAMLVRAFIRAHETCSQYTLEIYGDGELKKELTELISCNQAESYISIKPESTDIFDHMNNAKIYVCSSDLKGEGYSNALLEAMGMGLACISTNCSGSVEELIKDGVNGLIVPPGDEDAMSKALIRLMKNDDIAREMAEQAANVRQTNAKDVIINRWVSFFDEVMDEGT